MTTETITDIIWYFGSFFLLFSQVLGLGVDPITLYHDQLLYDSKI